MHNVGIYYYHESLYMFGGCEEADNGLQFVEDYNFEIIIAPCLYIRKMWYFKIFLSLTDLKCKMSLVIFNDKM